MNTLVDSNIVSMSLRDIAEVPGSTHSHLIKSAERLVEEGVITFLANEPSYLRVIKIDQRLDKLDTITLVAQNRPIFIRKIVEALDEKYLDSLMKQVITIEYDHTLHRPDKLIYIIECEGLYKIGKSDNPPERLLHLSVGNPFELTLIGMLQFDNSINLEYLLHLKFGEKRVRGEWFRLTNEDITYILNHNQKEIRWVRNMQNLAQ